MKKSKIGHVIQALNFGRAETCLLDICKNINSKKFDVTVITFWEGDLLEKEFHKLSDIKIINLNCFSRYDFRIIFKLIKALKKENPDIIHTHLPIAGIYSRICNLFISVKIITTQHSVKYIKNFFHMVDRFTAKWNDYYVANSEYTKQFLVKYNYVEKKKIKVVPLGVDFSKLNKNKIDKTVIYKELNIPMGAFVVGHIGSFKIQKGHKYIVEFAKKIIPNNPKIYFLLIGDGALFHSVKEEIQKMGMSDNILLIGKKNNIADYLKIMDIFMMPSVSESFGISILESMYMKLPVVAFSTDAIPELINNRETGMLVEKFNVEKFIESIFELYVNVELRNRISENAYSNVIDNYSIKNTTKKNENIYLSILGLE